MKEKIKKFFKSESGFTLIELLVVIGIIAILATIGAVNFSSARGKARDAKRIADGKQIETAIQVDAAGRSTGAYTDSSTELTDLTGLTAPATTAYCYYTSADEDTYLVAVLGIEDPTTAAEGFDTDVSVPIGALKVDVDEQTTVCPGTPAGNGVLTAAAAIDCDDSTATDTICFEDGPDW